MNDGGRPGGSPLRWDTWSVWPDRGGGALPRELFVAAMNEGVGMNDGGRPGGSPLRWDTWSVWPDRGGEALPRDLIVAGMNERVGMNDRGRLGGSPLRWDTWSVWPDRGGEALPRDLFVAGMNERVGMNDRGRPSGSPLRWDTWSVWPDRVGARHCLALIRRRHHPGALPRDLFVPAMNERVGMNDRGRPSGSPLRWDTWSVWPDRVGARHCLALIRRRPPFRGPALRFVCPGHEGACWHE